jgi:hypothetical protein
MISALITILVALLVLVIVFWIVKIAGEQFGAPAVIIQIVGLILLLIFLLFLFNQFGGGMHIKGVG